jgi:hypothetical protein
MDWLAGNPIIERLEALRVQYPRKPLVLATRKDADNVRLLRRIAIDEVVWTEDMEHSLGGAIERARGSSVFQDIAARFDGATHLPLKLRTALAHVFRLPKPIPTLEDLAAIVGCDRRTLWRLWVSAVPRDAGLRLQDVLDWNLLLHACVLRGQAPSWSGVARKLSVHEHTLARAAKRLTGLSLRQLAETSPDVIVGIFHDRALMPISNRVAIHAA